MTSRRSWDDYFMELACSARERGTCPRRQVGAVLVNPHKRIISTGYNGAKPGEPHCIDVGCVMASGACIRTLHAEENAIKHATRKQRCGSTLYSTDYPCRNCALLAAKSGIVQVIYMIDYRYRSDEVLLDAGIAFRKHVPLLQP